MFDQMKQLMEMKKKADMIKRELDAMVIEVEDSGIRMKVNGSQMFQSVEIDGAKLMLENKARLEADLLRSLNAALKKSQETAAVKMKDLLPGLPGL